VALEFPLLAIDPLGWGAWQATVAARNSSKGASGRRTYPSNPVIQFVESNCLTL
jgi:hypothetical protein